MAGMSDSDEMADFIRTARRLAAERKKKARHRSAGLRSGQPASSLRGFGRPANSDDVQQDQVSVQVIGKRTA